MPGGKTKKKTGGRRGKKTIEKKSGQGVPCDGDMKIGVGDLVSLDAKKIIVHNIGNNNSDSVHSDKPENENVEATCQDSELNEEVSDVRLSVEEFDTVNLNDAFLDVKNNNQSDTKNEYFESHKKLKESPLAAPSASIKKKEKPYVYKYKEYKTIQDYMDDGVPKHIAEMKHPLQHSWTLWYHGNDKELSWEQNQHKVVTVATIEDFWQVFHYLEPASQIGNSCDYSLFKKGIFPDWEDIQNSRGGRWNVNSDRGNRGGEGGQLDSWWLEILLILIGEQAGGDAGLVNGAVVNIKNKTDKLAIWLSDSRDMTGVMNIGRLLKTRLGLGSSSKIFFTVHSEDKNKPVRTRFGSGGSPGKISL